MIAQQLFGHTNHKSTRVIFGAAALSMVTQEEADQTLEVLLESGINHIDTAASYGDSELRICPWMEKHRQDFFLATKTEERTYKKAYAEFHRSLERLQVSKVDLLQLHNLIHPIEWDIAMGPGGAIKAAIEAREQGLVRYIGVTGHGLNAPVMHKRSLERFDFDSVLLPYNYMMMQNPQYTIAFKDLLTLCEENNVAVQTIKSITRGPWGDKIKTHATWYEPLEDQFDIDLAVHWALNHKQIFLNTVGDIYLLPKVLDAANRFRVGPSDDDMQTAATRMGLTPLFV